MNDLTLKDAFDIYGKSRDQILTIWNFFAVVTLGVVVWALGGDKPPAPDSRSMIIAGYTFFAICNFFAVAASQYELQKWAKELARMSGGHPVATAFTPTPFPPAGLLGFYFVIILIVDAAIYFAPASRAVAS